MHFESKLDVLVLIGYLLSVSANFDIDVALPHNNN
jgi:hypothetical protein